MNDLECIVESIMESHIWDSDIDEIPVPESYKGLQWMEQPPDMESLYVVDE